MIVFIKCANQMSPPGGEVDKIPPTIIETYPPNGTTNFDKKTINFTFSEYVNKRDINEAFFISPLIEGIPNFSWTNKTVYIEFPESLNSNTTYSVIIGTEITDFNNRNNMTEPFNLTFSTGSKIDSGKISGRVYTSSSDGTLIFAYKTDSGRVNIYNEKPNYISQINAKGYYELNGLSDGSYIIFAILDEFKDLVYNIGDDQIGIPRNIATLNSNQNSVKDFNFFIHLEDTLSPNIINVTMTDKHHLVVEFNEPIDSSRFNVDNFEIYDSTANKSYPLTYWFQTNSKKYEYVLCLSDSLSVQNNYYLHSSRIFDKIGNILEFTEVNFTASDKPDTSNITITRIETPFNNSVIDFMLPKFRVHFSDAFDTSKTNQAITMLTADSINIPVTVKYLNNALIEVSPNIQLKPKLNYTVNLNMSYFEDISGNKADTIISKRLVTVSDLDFTGVSGIIKSNYQNVKIVLDAVNKKRSQLQISATKSNSFNFSRVEPGEYLIWAYVDEDSNNSYSFGEIEPLVFSELFKFYSDTLNLRARWPVGDIEIDFTK